ncbi:MAG TPA: histidine kinase dimerization/phospho-acceptor domain-containing protein [Pyrinomonadaceae bacterium]
MEEGETGGLTSPDAFRVDSCGERNRVKSTINVPHKQPGIHGNLIISKCDSHDFAKAMSHELRTPLNVIIGMCQFLDRDQKTPLSAMHRDAVNRMDRNARALLQSVNHLLDCLRQGKFN